MSDVTRMTATQIAGLVASKEVSAVEVATAHLDRIDAVDERVHAFLHVDREGALAAARAVDAGELRDDISAEDLLRALVGMCYMHDQPGWQASVMRMLDVLVDGLRAKP